MQIRKDGKLRIEEVKWGENRHRLPLWDEVMRLLLSESLTTSGDGANLLDEDEGPIQKEEDDG